MKHDAIRFWFGVAAAVVAAAIADPFVEAISNAGWFGPESLTDHSNLDVFPALICGLALLMVALALRVRKELLRTSREALRTNVGRLLPAIFGLQLAVLFVMETIEQIFVAGHPLGGTIWLGGPLWFSLTVHAAICVAIAFALSRAVCMCARTTLRVIRHLRALAMRALHAPAPHAPRTRGTAFSRCELLVHCRIGNRAPPFSLV